MCVEVPPESPAYRLLRVWLTPAEIKGGYLGYANQVLWPLCHITLDRINYLKAFWPAYRSENHRFANAVLEELDREPGQVWIHDFHLGGFKFQVQRVNEGAVAHRLPGAWQS